MTLLVMMRLLRVPYVLYVQYLVLYANLACTLPPPRYVGVILSSTFSVTSFPKIKFDANQAK